MVQRSVPECFLIHYSATTKIRNMKMINNTKSFRLPLFLFMTNLPTMRQPSQLDPGQTQPLA